MELKFKPVEDKKPIVLTKFNAVIIAEDRVDCDGVIYAIAESSKSIRGQNVFYVDVTKTDDPVYQSIKPKESTVKVLSKFKYMGENPALRPYRIGLDVSGRVMNDGTFVITNIKHLQSNETEHAFQASEGLLLVEEYIH